MSTEDGAGSAKYLNAWVRKPMYGVLPDRFYDEIRRYILWKFAGTIWKLVPRIRMYFVLRPEDGDCNLVKCRTVGHNCFAIGNTGPIALVGTANRNLFGGIGGLVACASISNKQGSRWVNDKRCHGHCLGIR